MDCRRRGILILWRQHTFLTLAGVEPMDFAISIDERPSAAICRTRRRLSGVNRTGRLAFFVMAISGKTNPYFWVWLLVCQNWRRALRDGHHVLKLFPSDIAQTLSRLNAREGRTTMPALGQKPS